MNCYYVNIKECKDCVMSSKGSEIMLRLIEGMEVRQNDVYNKKWAFHINPRSKQWFYNFLSHRASSFKL